MTADGVSADDIPVAHTPPGGVGDTFPEPVLAGCTAILVSHRFSTVRMADRIAVLDHGRLVEAGAHDELVALGGRYARLFALQAEGYR